MATSKRTTGPAPLRFADYDYGWGMVYLAAVDGRAALRQRIDVHALLERSDLLARLSARDVRRVKRFASLRREVRERIARAFASAARAT